LIGPIFAVFGSKMANSSEPDLESVHGDKIGGSSVDIEMVRFIREEIRTAVQQEMNTAPTVPPAYDSSVPLLIEDTLTHHPNNDTNAEAQGVDAPKLRRRLHEASNFLPIIAIIASVLVLCITGIDELYISALAFMLLVCLSVIHLVVFVSAPLYTHTRLNPFPHLIPLLPSQDSFLSAFRVLLTPLVLQNPPQPLHRLQAQHP
jgi:hypothetical protein